MIKNINGIVRQIYPSDEQRCEGMGMDRTGNPRRNDTQQDQINDLIKSAD